MIHSNLNVTGQFHFVLFGCRFFWVKNSWVAKSKAVVHLLMNGWAFVILILNYLHIAPCGMTKIQHNSTHPSQSPNIHRWRSQFFMDNILLFHQGNHHIWNKNNSTVDLMFLTQASTVSNVNTNNVDHPPADHAKRTVIHDGWDVLLCENNTHKHACLCKTKQIRINSLTEMGETPQNHIWVECSLSVLSIKRNYQLIKCLNVWCA